MRLNIPATRTTPAVIFWLDKGETPHSVWGTIRNHMALQTHKRPEDIDLVLGATCPHGVALQYTSPDDVPTKDTQFDCALKCYFIKYPNGELVL